MMLFTFSQWEMIFMETCLRNVMAQAQMWLVERLNYTGSMLLAHFAGAPEQLNDEYVRSDPFTEVSIRLGYTIEFPNIDSGVEIFGGATNLFNAYQSDFDTGKHRDSGYIYGPGVPRTIFIGLRLKSL